MLFCSFYLLLFKRSRFILCEFCFALLCLASLIYFNWIIIKFIVLKIKREKKNERHTAPIFFNIFKNQLASTCLLAYKLITIRNVFGVIFFKNYNLFSSPKIIPHYLLYFLLFPQFVYFVLF